MKRWITHTRPRPAVAASVARMTVSVRSWRMMRRREAPIERRMAISRRRIIARPVWSALTLVQVTSRTSVASRLNPMFMPSDSPSNCGSAFIARMGTTSVPLRRLLADGCVASIAAAARLPMTSTAGVACCGVTPGASRAAAVKVSTCELAPGMTSGLLASGIQTVIGSYPPMPVKRSGATPTTLTARPSSVIVRPRTAGSREKKRSHTP
jgi:hypothetical protein